MFEFTATIVIFAIGLFLVNTLRCLQKALVEVTQTKIELEEKVVELSNVIQRLQMQVDKLMSIIKGLRFELHGLQQDFQAHQLRSQEILVLQDLRFKKWIVGFAVALCVSVSANVWLVMNR
jgi:uncharacterized protein YoxC